MLGAPHDAGGCYRIDQTGYTTALRPIGPGRMSFAARPSQPIGAVTYGRSRAPQAKPHAGACLFELGSGLIDLLRACLFGGECDGFGLEFHCEREKIATAGSC